MTFNVPGDSIPSASMGKPNGVATLDENGKVTAEQASATVKLIKDTAAYTLTAEDMGKLLIVQMSSGVCTITIPADADMSLFPLGSEIEISKWNIGVSVNIAVDAEDANELNIRTRDANAVMSITIDGSYGIVSLKRIASSKWYAAGDIA